MSANLEFLVDTFSAKAKDIKSLHQLINGIKKKGTPNSGGGMNEGGGTTVNVCPHCASVGRSNTHKNDSCYFDPKKTTKSREWDCTLMEEKGVSYKDDN